MRESAKSTTRGVVAGAVLFVRFETSEKGVVGMCLETKEESSDLDFAFDDVFEGRFGDLGILVVRLFVEGCQQNK